MKFATKRIRHSPPHLRNVATLSWEIKKSNCLVAVGERSFASICWSEVIEQFPARHYICDWQYFGENWKHICL